MKLKIEHPSLSFWNKLQFWKGFQRFNHWAIFDVKSLSWGISSRIAGHVRLKIISFPSSRTQNSPTFFTVPLQLVNFENCTRNNIKTFISSINKKPNQQKNIYSIELNWFHTDYWNKIDFSHQRLMDKYLLFDMANIIWFILFEICNLV